MCVCLHVCVCVCVFMYACDSVCSYSRRSAGLYLEDTVGHICMYCHKHT